MHLKAINKIKIEEEEIKMTSWIRVAKSIQNKSKKILQNDLKNIKIYVRKNVDKKCRAHTDLQVSKIWNEKIWKKQDDL